MKKKLSFLLAAVMVLAAVTLSGCAKEDDGGKSDLGSTSTSQKNSETEVKPIVWKFSTFDAEGTDYFNAYRTMWDRVEKETNGRLKIEMHPLGVLGGEADLLQNLQTGNLEAAQIGCALLAGYEDAFNVGDLPFIFDDFDHADRFAQTEEAQAMNAALEDDGFLVWYWSVLGYRQPNLVNGVINSPDDFKGLKWRTMEVPVQMDTMKALGAIPVAVPYNDVYNALQTHLVDAWMNDGVAFKNLSTYDVAPYYCDIPLFASTQTCVISKKAFDALDPELQEIVERVVRQDLPGVIKVAWNQNTAQLEELKENNFKDWTKVEDTTPYLELVQPVYDNLVEQYPECQTYIDAINRVR